MQHIINLVHLMKSSGFPRGFVDTNYMTEKERAAFIAACDRHNVKISLQLVADREAEMASQ